MEVKKLIIRPMIGSINLDKNFSDEEKDEVLSEDEDPEVK